MSSVGIENVNIRPLKKGEGRVGQAAGYGIDDSLYAAANNMAQFPAGISTCALFISWFCYVRNVEVEKEISNKSYSREKY
jgi:hypothetical protein